MVHSAFANLLNASETRSRTAIAALPDGRYEASDIIDGDGVSQQPIHVKVAVTIAGDGITIDFTGCPPAVAGPINCARGALQSAVRTIVKAMVGPQDPSNEGWFRPLTVIAPRGTIFTAEKPSPTGWYYEGSVHASELVWKALAPLMPSRFSAGSYSSLCVVYISGKDRSGQPFIHIEPQHGGWGASEHRDGAGALIAPTDGDTYNYSVEVIEARFPLRVMRYGFNVEGGTGAGRRRGGFGIVREYEILSIGRIRLWQLWPHFNPALGHGWWRQGNRQCLADRAGAGRRCSDLWPRRSYRSQQGRRLARHHRWRRRMGRCLQARATAHRARPAQWLSDRGTSLTSLWI